MSQDENIGYILIDPPISAYSSVEEITAWINELKDHPHKERTEIKEAIVDAQRLLLVIKKH